jgi:hypothetical protein
MVGFKYDYDPHQLDAIRAYVIDRALAEKRRETAAR